MIYDFIDTKEELLVLSSNVDSFLLDLYRYSGEELENHISNTYDYRFKSILENVLSKEGLSLKNSSTVDIEAKIKALKDSLADANIVELKISFSPTQKFIGQIKNWLMSNIGTNVLLDLKIDSDVLAGAVITYNGRYNDLSLSTALKNYELKL